MANDGRLMRTLDSSAGSPLGTVVSAVGWSAPADIGIRAYGLDRISPSVPGDGTDYVVPLIDGRSNFTDERASAPA